MRLARWAKPAVPIIAARRIAWQRLFRDEPGGYTGGTRRENMLDDDRERLTGRPSDYGGRSLSDEERRRTERGEIGRTADGDPQKERGTADSANAGDPGDEESPQDDLPTA